MCKVSTDQGPIEADNGGPDFARLVSRLDRLSANHIEYVKIEHPIGGTLTLGVKSSQYGERLFRFRHVDLNGVIRCSKRVETRTKRVRQLADFFACGDLGDSLVWVQAKSFAFDREEVEALSRSRLQPLSNVSPLSAPLPASWQHRVPTGASPAPFCNDVGISSVPPLSPPASFLPSKPPKAQSDFSPLAKIGRAHV